MAGVPGNIADMPFALQSAKGSAASASQWRLWLAGGSAPHSVMVKEDFEETTGARMLSDSYVSESHVEGEPDLFLMPVSAVPLIYGVLGAKAVSGASDPYTHTLTVATSVPYFTFWQSLGAGKFEKFKDCIITGLKIRGEANKPLIITPRIMGLTPSYLAAAETTVAVEKTNRFMHYDGSGALLVEGAAVASIRSFEIDIDNGAEMIPGDSLHPNDVSIGRLSIVCTATMLVADFDLWERLMYASSTPSGGDAVTKTPLELAGSPAGLSFTWTRVATTRILTAAIPRVQVDPFDDQPDVSGNPLVRTVTYRAYAPTDGSTPATFTMKNATASYAAA